MHILRGKGKIYDSSGKYINGVTYEIRDKSPNESVMREWWGEITPDELLLLAGEYIIELDDGRRGPCVTTMKTKNSFGLVIDSYDIKGTDALTR